MSHWAVKSVEVSDIVSFAVYFAIADGCHGKPRVSSYLHSTSVGTDCCHWGRFVIVAVDVVARRLQTFGRRS